MSFNTGFKNSFLNLTSGFPSSERTVQVNAQANKAKNIDTTADTKHDLNSPQASSEANPIVNSQTSEAAQGSATPQSQTLKSLSTADVFNAVHDIDVPTVSDVKTTDKTDPNRFR